MLRVLVRTVESVSERLGRIEAALASPAPVPDAYSPATVAAKLDIPRRMVLAAIRSGDLPAIRPGERTAVVLVEDYEAYKERLRRAGP